MGDISFVNFLVYGVVMLIVITVIDLSEKYRAGNFKRLFSLGFFAGRSVRRKPTLEECPEE